MIRFPYGIADFRRIRREGMVYVDRTAHVRDLEDLGDVLVFLRPRRFGKSLWLSTLASYYDLRLAEDVVGLGLEPDGLDAGRERDAAREAARRPDAPASARRHGEDDPSAAPCGTHKGPCLPSWPLHR